MVLWHRPNYFDPPHGLFDRTCLILKLDPQYVKTLYAFTWYYTQKIELRPLDLEHIVIGKTVVTFGHYEVQGRTVLPFALMTGDVGQQTWAIQQDSYQGPSFDH